MKMMTEWRVRLLQAVRESGKSQCAIALEAGTSDETVSRVLHSNQNPSFETLVRIVHATGHTVGWLLGERGYTLSLEQVKELRRVAAIIEDVTKEEA